MYSSFNKADEYTDYSCSTAIERLARDVETLLRNWHVDNGSDRHVSIAKQEARSFSIQSVPLIRSERLTWTLALPLSNRRTSVSVELDLSLWDAPSTKRGKDLEFDLEHLPYSLRRESQVTEMPLYFFDSFSNLFGIGQHITLTPVTTSNIPPELMQYLGLSLIQRHHEKETLIWVMGSMLSSWLQTALNCAVSNCYCCIPVFGIWGNYPSDPKLGTSSNSATIINGKVQVFPPWMQVCRQIEVPAGSMRYRKRRHKNYLNRKYVPSLLAGSLLPNRTFSLEPSRVRSTFSCSVVQGRSQSIIANSGLTVWGSVLLRHCEDSTVVLWGARHVYSWLKPHRPVRSLLFSAFVSEEVEDKYHEWRRNEHHSYLPDGQSDVQKYRRNCENYVLSLLDSAAGATLFDPIWGPADDPIKSIHATVAWNARADDDGVVGPLLGFPLRIRSRAHLSRDDWIDMEESVERTILDPCRSDSFVIQTFYDNETMIASLAATQRCTLAALIRTATLPDEALLKHITDEDLIERWDYNAGNVVAQNLAMCANVSKSTCALVHAMDWGASVEDMISFGEASEIVEHVMDGSAPFGFPSPPEQMFFEDAQNEYGDFAFALLKSAPVGRLLSLLFVRMARLRSPCSIALVWSIFVNELRVRWEAEDSLPNMNYVPGFDPPPEVLHKGHGISSIGVRAEFSAFLNCSEPDPDDGYCLIGQKLQVFNICVESLTSRDIQPTQEEKNTKSCGTNPTGLGKDPAHSLPAVSSSTGLSDTSRDKGNNEVYNQSEQIDRINVSVAQSSARASSRNQEFFDAEDSNICTELEPQPNVSEKLDRKGARCPVLGTSLIASGDQMYAPYLQRPFPLTDDIVAERRLMLSRRGSTPRNSVRARLEIAFRYQKSKLLSDMSAFKAANPGAIFQDFITWYGNPGDPLDDYNSSAMDGDQAGSGKNGVDSVALKLDMASEAMYILNETRDFWANTWEEASNMPASDQKPIFDASSTVEMAIDYLESMHPAILVNQVMAVNFAMAYFTLFTSAGKALNVAIVKSSFERLREKTVEALQLLSKDVKDSTCISRLKKDEFQSYEGSSSFVSVRTISSCEIVCSRLGEVEALTARTTSLLHKFPGNYELVEKIIRRANGEEIAISCEKARNSLLSCIQRQQAEFSTKVEQAARPTLREYVLRNLDDSKPCQLSVRYGDGKALHGDGEEDEEGGLLIALTKSFSE